MLICVAMALDENIKFWTLRDRRRGRQEGEEEDQRGGWGQQRKKARGEEKGQGGCLWIWHTKETILMDTVRDG